MTSNAVARQGVPICEGTVLPEWIDTNEHMNVAYYVLAFDLAVDKLWHLFGIDERYIRNRRNSTFAVGTVGPRQGADDAADVFVERLVAHQVAGCLQLLFPPVHRHPQPGLIGIERGPQAGPYVKHLGCAGRGLDGNLYRKQKAEKQFHVWRP